MKLLLDKLFLHKLRVCYVIIMTLFAIPLWSMLVGGMDIYYVAIPLIVLMQVYLVFRFKRTPLFLLFTLYCFLYFFYLIPYFYFDMQLSAYQEYQERLLFSNVVFQFYVFYAAICMSTLRVFNPDGVRLKDKVIIHPGLDTKILFFFLLLACFGLVWRQGENVLASSSPYQAYMDNLESTNALPLLFMMLLCTSYFMIKNRRFRNVFIITILFLIFVYAVTRGYRVLIAPIGFLFFLLYLEGHVKVRTVIAIFFLGFILLVGVNALKMGNEFSWSLLFSENDEFILSHHADNLYGSAAATGLVFNQKISFWDRILLDIGVIGQSVIPPSQFPDSMRYPLVINLFTRTGGGGLYVTAAYVHCGYIGLYILTYLIAEFIRSAYVRNSSVWAFLAMIVLMFSANWFSYDFHVLFRFPILAAVIYFVMTKLTLSKYYIR